MSKAGRNNTKAITVPIASPMFSLPINSSVSVLFVKKVFSNLKRSLVTHPARSKPNGKGESVRAVVNDAF